MTQMIPIFAADIAPDGSAVEIEVTSSETPVTEGYRWLHLAIDDPGARDWVISHLPPLAAETLLQPQTRPRVSAHANGLLVNLRGVNLNPGQDDEDMASLRIWITPKLIVSMRFQKIYTINDMIEAARSQAAPASPSAWLSRLVDGLTDRIEDVTVQIDQETEQLEDAAYDNADPASDLAPLRRKVIKLRRFLGPQRDALRTLVTGTPQNGLTPEVLASLDISADRMARAVEELDAARDRLAAVGDLTDARQAERLNRNSYVLSVIAAVFLPLGFLTGLLGVNVAGIPGAEWPYSFLTLCAGMTAIGVGTVWVLRRINWI